MTKLLELHDLLKDHPYRRPSITNNNAYKESYGKLYLQLLDKLYDYADNDGFDPIVNKGVKGMYHDCARAIWHIKHSTSDYNECSIFLEQMLSIIHKLLETNDLPYYYEYRDKETMQMRLSNDRTGYHPYYKDKTKYLKIIEKFKNKWSDISSIEHILEYYQKLYNNYEEYFGEKQ